MSYNPTKRLSIQHAHRSPKMSTIRSISVQPDWTETEASKNPSQMTMAMHSTFDQIIKHDHAQIVKYMTKYFEIPKVDVENRKRHVNSIIRGLAIHSVSEEMSVYPAVEKHLPNGKDEANRLRAEHLELKKDLQRVDFMPINDANLEPLLRKIFTEFEHHAKLEENEDFPKLRKAMSSEEAMKLGREYEDAKGASPTHPHPSAPDHGGIMEKAAGMASVPLDKLIDAQREFVKED
ncbi:hypothetical protein SeMB42_g04592 [Synchytrium endobioticum]|uniref:Hemerythrin-like domain-containing protein n=1 Tax=Synchytrium endobioticum TaxID=286115 RepID=A0A507CXC8_9FUNG|nr:hypothetical protein SeMB42_g04592 [Synchytrium endobioticum]